jgi:hypothetical protein
MARSEAARTAAAERMRVKFVLLLEQIQSKHAQQDGTDENKCGGPSLRSG